MKSIFASEYYVLIELAVCISFFAACLCNEEFRKCTQAVSGDTFDLTMATFIVGIFFIIIIRREKGAITALKHKTETQVTRRNKNKLQRDRIQ